MRRPHWGRRRWLLTCCVLAPFAGLVGVTVAELFPDGRIAAQLVSAMHLGELDGEDRPISALGPPEDRYSECVAVMMGLGDPPGTPLRRALFSATSYGCVPAVERLDAFARSGELVTQPDYMRYWHGYTVVTRPALAIVGLSGTRWLCFGALALSIVGLARAAQTRFGWAVALLLIVPALLTTDLIVGGWSLSDALGLATAWAGGWFVIEQVGADRSLTVTALAAALGGALNAYVDLMIAIPASLALCATGAALASVYAGERPGRRLVARTSVAAGGWAAGLAVMWTSKWAFAWLFVDRDRIVDSVRNQISFRTGGDFEGVTGTRFNGFWKNVQFWWQRPLTPLVVVAVVVAAGALVWRSAAPRLDRRGLAWAAAAAGVVAAAVLGWYVALDNHNQIHSWLTHRSIAVTFGALAALLVAAACATTGVEAEPAGYARSERDGLPGR